MRLWNRKLGYTAPLSLPIAIHPPRLSCTPSYSKPYDGLSKSSHPHVCLFDELMRTTRIIDILAFYNGLVAGRIDFRSNPDIPISQEEYRQNGRNFVAGPPIEFQCLGAPGVHLILAENATFRAGDLLNTMGMLDGEVQSMFNTKSSKTTLRVLVRTTLS